MCRPPQDCCHLRVNLLHPHLGCGGERGLLAFQVACLSCCLPSASSFTPCAVSDCGLRRKGDGSSRTKDGMTGGGEGPECNEWRDQKPLFSGWGLKFSPATCDSILACTDEQTPFFFVDRNKKGCVCVCLDYKLPPHIHLLKCLWVRDVAHLVKNPPARQEIQETRVRSLG